MTNEDNDDSAELAAGADDTTVVPAHSAPHVAPAHTPGPWRVFGGAYRFIVAREEHPRKLICDAPDSEPYTDEERANVHLIAAAPEMYAALKAVATDRHACGTMRHRAEYALAKAEGKAVGSGHQAASAKRAPSTRRSAAPES